VRRALERQELEAEVRDLRGQLESGGPLARMIGASDAIRAVVQRVRTVAATELSVVIQGETGTGKELVARAVHQLSARGHGPFVAVDCGAIPESLMEAELFGHERGAFTGAERRREGLFKLAHGGTLFFDEIGNLPVGLQPKLLRALQERAVTPLAATRPIAVDVRVIAATHEDLAARSAAGSFREDLFYRLDEFAIALPPLRSRSGDVALLARHFLDEAATELRRPVTGLTDEALRLLAARPWPGNVRQLRNVVRQAVLEAGGAWIGVTDLNRAGPPSISTPAPAGALRDVTARAIAEAERRAITAALRQTGGNKSRAARLLQVDFKTLHSKMRRYGIRAMEPSP
jgi:DNA-binding NtrC family response regulator